MASPVFFRVHENAVHAFNRPGGEVYRLVDRVVDNTKAIAMVEAPQRTGHLVSRIQKNRPKSRGGYRIAGQVTANAAYTLYVHDGTSEITPAKGAYLVVPRGHEFTSLSGDAVKAGWSGKGARPYFLARSISGQEANPFLERSLQMALAREGLITYTRGVAV